MAANVRRSSASGAMPMPPPTRIAPAAPGESSLGVEKELPSGPLTQTLLARLQLAEPVGARADPLDQEVEPHPLTSSFFAVSASKGEVSGGLFGDREGSG